jgi:lipopolysaccharide heptosyltransferase II
MEKYLVIQTAFIGDAILTLPMIQKLKKLNPQASIDILTIPSAAEIFSASPYINNVLIIDKKNKHKSFNSLLKFIKEIRKLNYSRIYSPHRSYRSSLIVYKSGVKETFGFNNSKLSYIYKNKINYVSEHHEVQRNLHLIGFNYSGDEWRILPELNISKETEERITSILNEKNISGNFIAIAPGTVWETKKYPTGYYEEIIKYFCDKNYKIVLIGGKKDEDLCEKISSKFNHSVISFAGKFSIIESIEILKRSKILISNDSAPTHMGMCADIPVLTIYCSTVANFGFYPYSKKSAYLSYNDLLCKPCGIHGRTKCPINTFDCGYKLEPKIIISKIEEMLNGKH